VNKTAASAAQLAKCILLHAYSRRTASSQQREHNQKLRIVFNKLALQYFGYKLRTIEAENPSKVKNSEPQLRIYWFLYKKVYVISSHDH